MIEAQSLKTVWLRIFLSSRPEILVRHGFYQMPETEHRDFVLHNISPSIVDHDISIFLEHNLSLIKQECFLDTGWPGEQIIRSLVQNASGLFIWAATTYRFVREGKRFAQKRLNTILKSSNTSASAPENHLDEIYVTVLKQSISPDFTDEEKENSYCILRHIIGCLMILFSTLSANSLCKLLHVTRQDIDQTLDGLHALEYPRGPSHPASSASSFVSRLPSRKTEVQ